MTEWGKSTTEFLEHKKDFNGVFIEVWSKISCGQIFTDKKKNYSFYSITFSDNSFRWHKYFSNIFKLVYFNIFTSLFLNYSNHAVLLGVRENGRTKKKIFYYFHRL